MAKSKKKTSTKKSATPKVPESVEKLLTTAENVADVFIPGDLQERFAPQIERVTNRLNKIAINLTKAIELGATKTERDAKKKDRIAKRQKKLEGQLQATQAKLDALKSD